MRGAKVEMGAMFSYLSSEERVSADHPLRAIRGIVDRSLAERDGHFNQIYSALAAPRFPQSTCFALCVCRSFTVFAPSGS